MNVKGTGRDEQQIIDEKRAVWDKFRNRIVNPGSKKPVTALDLVRQLLVLQSFANWSGFTGYTDHGLPGIGGHAVAYSVTLAMSTMFLRATLMRLALGGMVTA